MVCVTNAQQLINSRIFFFGTKNTQFCAVCENVLIERVWHSLFHSRNRVLVCCVTQCNIRTSNSIGLILMALSFDFLLSLLLFLSLSLSLCLPFAFDFPFSSSYIHIFIHIYYHFILIFSILFVDLTLS